MNPRLAQLLGIILVITSIAMTLLVCQSTLMLESTDIMTLIASGMVAWAILAMPLLIIGLWLVAKGTREARIGDVSGDLIPLVQKEVAALERYSGQKDHIVTS